MLEQEECTKHLSAGQEKPANLECTWTAASVCSIFLRLPVFEDTEAGACKQALFAVSCCDDFNSRRTTANLNEGVHAEVGDCCCKTLLQAFLHDYLIFSKDICVDQFVLINILQ